MAQIRNISGDARYVPELSRTVEADAVTTVPDDRLGAFLQQSNVWRDETPAKKKGDD